MPSDTVTTTKAADILGVSVSSIVDWERKGLLRCWRTPGGHRRFRLADIEAFSAPQLSAAARDSHSRADSPTHTSPTGAGQP